jgi:hypothetical protein
MTAVFSPSRGSVLGLLTQARSVMADAVAADRSRPAGARRRLVSVWVLLDKLAPEYAEWAAYFAAGAQVRAAVEAGAISAVTSRAADDQIRAATEFLSLVESSLGLLAA